MILCQKAKLNDPSDFSKKSLKSQRIKNSLKLSMVSSHSEKSENYENILGKNYFELFGHKFDGTMVAKMFNLCKSKKVILLVNIAIE